jgi:phosphoglycerate dehydrogenase-like enzyme
VNVLVLIHSPVAMWNIPAAHCQRLAAVFPQHTFLHARDDREGLALIREAEVAFSSQVYRDQLAAATRLRWIHSPAAGVGGMLYHDMLQSPVVITNSRGMSAETIAEHVLAVTLALFRRLHLAVARQAERRWAQDEIGMPPANRLIAGSRVLIVGLGSIGGAAASRFAALGAVVSGVRRRVEAGPSAAVDQVVGPERLRELLPSADIVVLSAAQTVGTHHLIGAGELALMKRDALLVNVSRGKLVDEAALAAALHAGLIGGAALDVFEHEPLVADSPLWLLPNVLITPHTSGFRPDHWDAATSLFAENLTRFGAGAPLVNLVDKRAGY